MKVYLGSDHRGIRYKELIKGHLTDLGYEFCDMGANDPSVSCDYPQYAYQVGEAVANDRNQHRGILICMSGIGQTIAANKVNGVLAALCYNEEAAKLSRQHNNANVLVLSSLFVSEDEIKSIIKVWLETPFEGGRHQRRVDQIRMIEKGQVPE